MAGYTVTIDGAEYEIAMEHEARFFDDIYDYISEEMFAPRELGGPAMAALIYETIALDEGTITNFERAEAAREHFYRRAYSEMYG